MAEFVTEPIARAAGSGSCRIASLDHETADDTVEDDVVVEAVVGEEHPVVHGLRSIRCVEFHGDVTGGRVDDGGVRLVEVDGEVGRGVVSLGHGWSLREVVP